MPINQDTMQGISVSLICLKWQLSTHDTQTLAKKLFLKPKFPSALLNHSTLSQQNEKVS